MVEIISNFSFVLGLFVTLFLSATIFLFWLLGALNNIRVERVGLFIGYSRFNLFDKTINNLRLTLGFIPITSYVKLNGAFDENEFLDLEKEAPKPYEFRSKSLFVRSVVVFTAPLLFLIIALFIFNQNTQLTLIEILKHLINTALFIKPIGEAQILWDQLFTNYTFLFGYIAFLASIGGFLTNISMLKKGHENLILLITLVFFVFLYSPVLRLTYAYFNFKSLLLFLLSTLLFGTIVMLIFFLLAKSFKRLTN